MSENIGNFPFSNVLQFNFILEKTVRNVHEYRS